MQADTIFNAVEKMAATGVDYVKIGFFPEGNWQTQSRETGNIGHTRRRKTKQTQSRETGNIGHKRRRKTWIVFV
jgi:hypothetical protein